MAQTTVVVDGVCYPCDQISFDDSLLTSSLDQGRVGIKLANDTLYRLSATRISKSVVKISLVPTGATTAGATTT